MEQVETNTNRKPVGRIIGIGVLVGAVIALVLVIFETDRYPRTDDASVTNMNISEGAYARPGSDIFTLIDTRTWYVVATIASPH